MKLFEISLLLTGSSSFWKGGSIGSEVLGAKSIFNKIVFQTKMTPPETIYSLQLLYSISFYFIIFIHNNLIQPKKRKISAKMQMSKWKALQFNYLHSLIYTSTPNLPKFNFHFNFLSFHLKMINIFAKFRLKPTKRKPKRRIVASNLKKLFASAV